MRRFLALGDSYTVGEGVGTDECWPRQLSRLLATRGCGTVGVEVLAATGWTSGELIDAIERDPPSGPFDMVSLLTGVNDQYRGLDPGRFRAGFKRLLGLACGFAGDEKWRVISLSIPDWSVTPYAEGRDRESVSHQIDRFNLVCREESLAAGVRFFDVTGISRRAAEDVSLLAGDGLHPSGQMYREWADLLIDVAAEILG